jgi:hypothetical protein
MNGPTGEEASLERVARRWAVLPAKDGVYGWAVDVLVENSERAGELGTWRVCISGEEWAEAEAEVLDEREGDVLVRARLLGEGRV